MIIKTILWWICWLIHPLIRWNWIVRHLYDPQPPKWTKGEPIIKQTLEKDFHIAPRFLFGYNWKNEPEYLTRLSFRDGYTQLFGTVLAYMKFNPGSCFWYYQCDGDRLQEVDIEFLKHPDGKIRYIFSQYWNNDSHYYFSILQTRKRKLFKRIQLRLGGEKVLELIPTISAGYAIRITNWWVRWYIHGHLVCLQPRMVTQPMYLVFSNPADDIDVRTYEW